MTGAPASRLGHVAMTAGRQAGRNRVTGLAQGDHEAATWAPTCLLSGFTLSIRKLTCLLVKTHDRGLVQQHDAHADSQRP